MAYRSGDFKRVCDVCGFDYYASETFKRWDGLIVCAEDFERRHPQDFVRGRTDRQNVHDARPVQPEVFLYPAGGPFFFVLNYDGVKSLEVVSATFRSYRGSVSPTASSL